ncbi:MAG: metallophosphoesterase [Micrococcales bacterium]|nr:metallophosphoesterase [Micrococcales bacterium]
MAPDLVVAAGDLPWGYLEHVASCVDAPLVFVPGNHDPLVARPRLHRSGMHFYAGLPVPDPRPHGGVNADGAILEVAGLRIAGLGGCVRYRPGPNQYTQAEFDKRAKRVARLAKRHLRKRPAIGAVLDILLTHAPPRHCGDEEDAPHHGIEALHPLIEQLRPRLLVHGHIHPYGQPRPDRQVGGTTIRNVVPYKVFDLPAGQTHAGETLMSEGRHAD